MRARPGLYWDAPDSGLGITIANRYPLWLLLLAIQTNNEGVEGVGRLTRAQKAGHQNAAGGLNGDSQRKRLDAGPFELGRGDRNHPASCVDDGATAVAGADRGRELEVIASLQASES